MYHNRNGRSSEHVYRRNQLGIFWPEKLVPPAVMSCAGECVEGERDCKASREGEEK